MSAAANFYENLRNRQFPVIEQSYDWKFAVTYALGLGYGADPLDRDQLKFVYEDGLQALPTMAVVMAYPGFWAKEPDTGIVWQKVLHGEQDLVIHKALPASGTVTGTTKVDQIIDKGSEKGSMLYSTREIREKATGELLAEVKQTTVMRGNGGFGGPEGPQPKPHAMPDGEPEIAVDLATLPQAALIYRLSGDFNPLHADPDVATQAGFKAPILHGLCTYGVAGHALIKGLCGYDAAKLRRMQVRFSSPVYPGETIRTEIWKTDAGKASFRARVVERDVVVLNNGYAEYDA